MEAAEVASEAESAGAAEAEPAATACEGSEAPRPTESGIGGNESDFNPFSNVLVGFQSPKQPLDYIGSETLSYFGCLLTAGGQSCPMIWQDLNEEQLNRLKTVLRSILAQPE